MDQWVGAKAVPFYVPSIVLSVVIITGLYLILLPSWTSTPAGMARRLYKKDPTTSHGQDELRL